MPSHQNIVPSCLQFPANNLALLKLDIQEFLTLKQSGSVRLVCWVQIAPGWYSFLAMLSGNMSTISTLRSDDSTAKSPTGLNLNLFYTSMPPNCMILTFANKLGVMDAEGICVCEPVRTTTMFNGLFRLHFVWYCCI